MHQNEDHKQLSEDDIPLSHIIPPSHILSDGRFIRLPPLSAQERATFFERAVAAHRLIVADHDDSGVKSNLKHRKRRNNTVDGDSRDDQQERIPKKARKPVDSPFVHPLAIASARLRSKGIDELSKAINLGTLVVGGEYFGLTNIVNQQLVGPNKNAATDTAEVAGEGSKGKEGPADENTSVGADSSGAGSGLGSVDGAVDESILLDQRLRSSYILLRRQTQYDNASTVLLRHGKRLSYSLSIRRILDARLRSLRRRWRLVAPEHGIRTIGPVQPREVVAVDVEVYDRDRLGGGSYAVDDTNLIAPGQIGRIARRTPRFATVELDKNYDVSPDIGALRKLIIDTVMSLEKSGSNQESHADKSRDAPFLSLREVCEIQKNNTPDSTENPACKTKAEPFAIADPTLGKIEPDFDPDKVPLLTLLFEIEKSSTGFIQHETLSSSFGPSLEAEDWQGGRGQNHSDELVIEALQHSLFCASLFESMRAEIIPMTTSFTPSTNTSSPSLKRHSTIAWLSSEMEESFLPPPSVMAGEDACHSGETRLLCVIHCHEGEVKVQLDEEYSLTVKLIEAGKASAARGLVSSAGDYTKGRYKTPKIAMLEKPLNHLSNDRGISGSESPAQLRNLCRALLLHSQSLFHNHCMKTRLSSSSVTWKKDKKPIIGHARTKREATIRSPHILQSCVGLGCKLIFEKKVRRVLRRLSAWLEEDMKCTEKISIQWLSLALFDSHSQFALLFRRLCLDVGIDGDILRVAQICDNTEYRTVCFGSASEFEFFLTIELRRALLAS